MKKLTNDEIKQIKNSLGDKFDKNTLEIVWNNFNNMHTVLESKMDLDTWTDQDKQDVLMAFKGGCTDSSRKFCEIVVKRFMSFIDRYSDYENCEYCRCCIVEGLCSGNPKNRDDDNWHYNITSILLHLSFI